LPKPSVVAAEARLVAGATAEAVWPACAVWAIDRGTIASRLENEAAFTAAKWTGLGLIGLYGFAGARLSGAGVLVSVMQAVGVALIGALLIALKALVH
jgi:hypothetical protein